MPELSERMKNCYISLARLTSMARMAGSTVHGIRNNLTIISSAVQLIQLKPDIEKQEINLKLDLVLDQIDSIMTQLGSIGQFKGGDCEALKSILPNSSLCNVIDVLKRKITYSGLSLYTNYYDDEQELRVDERLFEFLLFDMVESCIPSQKTAASLFVNSTKNDNTYVIDISTDMVSDGFMFDAQRSEVMVLIADHLGTELRLFGESIGWRLTLPLGS